MVVKVPHQCAHAARSEFFRLAPVFRVDRDFAEDVYRRACAGWHLTAEVFVPLAVAEEPVPQCRFPRWKNTAGRLPDCRAGGCEDKFYVHVKGHSISLLGVARGQTSQERLEMACVQSVEVIGVVLACGDEVQIIGYGAAAHAPEFGFIEGDEHGVVGQMQNGGAGADTAAQGGGDAGG